MINLFIKSMFLNSRHYIIRPFIFMGVMPVLLSLLFSSMAYATVGIKGLYVNDISVRGIVSDSISGDRLAGVTVRLKGSTEGTITDEDGKFSIEAEDGDVLIISLVGYQIKEIVVHGRSHLNILLTSSTRSLDQLVIVGFGSLKQKEVSSAITHITSDDLLSVGSSNALESIVGKVSGLNVQNTYGGDPNSTPSIQLRGVSSRSAGLSPLFVIDGVEGGDINNLNQNDIKSIDVLKGGAAAAIYGTRGSNGVIIITTKKGTLGSKVSYNGYARFDLPTRILRPLSAKEFLKHDRGPDFGHETNWSNESIRNFSFSQKHNIQFSGGSESTDYFVSLFFRNSKGIDLKSSREQYGARISVDHRSKNNLFKIGFGAAPRIVKSNFADHGSYNAYSSTISANPTMPVRDEENPENFFNIRTGFFNVKNPVEALVTNIDGVRNLILDMHGTLKVNLLDNLSTEITLSESYHNTFGFDFSPSTNSQIINNNGGRNTASRNYDRNDLKNFQWVGNYNLDLNRHSLKLLGGYSFSFNRISGLAGSNQDFPFDILTYNSLQDGSWNLNDGQNGVSSYQEDSRLISFFGRLNYSLNQKYFLSASLRHEGSSKFGSRDKWGSFPAVSIGWMLSDEEFMKNVKWINSLKFRADYGVTGNQDFGNYLSLATYSGYGYYKFLGDYIQVWGPSQTPNPFLHWEKAINYNIGVDFSFFNHALSGSVNYYIRENKDLLGNYNLPMPPNFSNSIFANVGTMKNSGFEVSLDANIVKTGSFTYNTSLVGSSISNQFVSFSNTEFHAQGYLDAVGMPAPNSPGNAQRLQEGKRIGSFYMLKSAGVDESGRLQVRSKNGKTIPATEALADDRTFVGNGLPRFSISLNNTFRYKNWDLSIFLRGKFDYDLFNTLAFYLGTPGTQTGSNVLSNSYDEDNKYSKLTSLDTYTMLSDYYLEPGDFVKVDNITLGYSFKNFKNIVNSFRIYITGRNLLTFTKWQGGDPEAVSTNGLYPGINNTISYFPTTLQIIVGININF